ncbi:calsyntenin-1 isoform X1 [Crotalus tigris]|uniref:calsyntenin-1 isoform X1 n=1 Tax=Crotalus tigris TaxID=88082 RepID=UPI00192F6497|nr:calsyntenin-1 isoform X1 [Crotalus tigris]
MRLLAPACLLAALLCGGLRAARVNKHKPWIETTYHGIVTENDNTVLLDPPLIALDKDSPLRFAVFPEDLGLSFLPLESFELTLSKEGEICGFKIHGQNVPFEAVVVDKSTGEGMIRSKEKLDCELQKEYTFTIQAYDCGTGPDRVNMKKSHKATVHIQVNDVNEYAPVFKEKSYKATAIEGKRYDNILKVEAVDADCSPQFSQICSYEIVTPEVPFAISKDGYIKNTEKLSFSKEHQYKLTVTAYDCGKKRAAEDVLVKISIKPTCKPGWQGWSKRMEYEPGTGALSLFPSIHLETCDEPIVSVQATVELETNHIGKGCDRDTYSEKSLHRLCGASSDTAELLPSPSNAANWTVNLPTDNGHESDQVFEFNGTQAVTVPESVVSISLKEPFVISVWMRHGPGAKEKETILCNSDKTDMSRHRYSLYVHNCRLVFLFRQDPSEGQSYKPAEFHWRLNQVCDQEWHHYILNVEFPVATLYVDGVSFDPFPVTEDYPLHASKIESQLVVGACWQEYTENENDTDKATENPAGGDQRMAQFFRGNLAGLTIRSGKLESKKVIDCLYTCKEGLDLPTADGAAKGLKIHMNPSQSALSLEGDDIERFDKTMQRISYVNSRQFPTPGIRQIKITSTVKCADKEACIAIPLVEGYVVVLQPEEPKISLSGIDHFARSASEFESPEGVSLFPELRIVSTITREVEPEGEGEEDPTVQESLVSEEIMHNLDTCEVSVLEEELNRDQESLEVDLVRLQQKGMEMSSSGLDLILTGVDTMASYEEVLHLIRYRNWHTVSLFDRKFKLVCSELNGRYVSNEFKVEVNVIHTANVLEHASHIAAQQPQFVQPVHHSFVDLSGHNLVNPHPGFSVVPSTATVVIVVCISFLVFMIILGVFRIRAAHQRTMRDQDSGKENEMDWDDSALTITVNPMETYEDQHSSEEEEEEEESEDGAEEDDITSAESESSEEEEEGGEQEDPQHANRQQQLEWDDSTLPY